MDVLNLRLRGTCILLIVTLAMAFGNVRGSDEPDGAYVGQKSYEFTARKPFAVDISVRDLFRNAARENLSVMFTQQCTHPVKTIWNKCQQPFLRTETAISKNVILFQNDWISYFQKKIDETCSPLDAYGDKLFSITMVPREMTTCKFVFNLTNPFYDYKPLGYIRGYFRVSQSETMKGYSTSIPIRSFKAGAKLTIHGNLDKHVSYFVGKCGLLDPNSLNVTTTEEDMNKLIRFQNLVCTDDQTDTFMTYLFTDRPINGAFYYSLPDTFEETSLFSSVFKIIGGIAVTIFCASLFGMCVRCNNSNDFQCNKEPLPVAPQVAA